MLKRWFLWRNKAYNFLNIFGLAIGIACAALIFLWVEDELNFDKVNVKKERLYAVRNNQSYDAGIFTHWSTPGVLGPAILKEIPGIANTCRKSEGLASTLFTIDDKPIYANGCYAEPSVFDMFTIPFVEGNPKTAFSQLYSIVLTEKTVKKFFGSEQKVVGRKLRMDNSQDYVITGVVKDFPENTSMQFEWVAPFQIYFDRSDWLHVWGNNSLTTYVELKPGVNPATVDKQLYNYIQKHVPNSISHLFLFGMNDWHLYDQFENGQKTGGGQIEYVRMFSIIAWIVLFIACINFMNLATARSDKRAREVGVRKVLGANKKSLIYQFIGEAVLMSLIAAAIAVVIILLVLPFFNELVQKQLTISLGEPLHILSLLGIALICGLIAGSYPSFYLSSFNPVLVLKGLKLKAGGAAMIRKGLVVLQFSVSIILITSTIIIYKQIQHIKSRELGFKKNNLVEVTMYGDMKRNFPLIRQELIDSRLIENAAISDHETLYGGNNTDDMTWPGKKPGEKVLISFRAVSPEYVRTSGMNIIDGRDFVPADTLANRKKVNIIVTEALAKMMGKGSAIGKIMGVDGDTLQATVVGVVNDYVYGWVFGKPDPVVFTPMLADFGATVMYVRINPAANVNTAIAKLEAVMKEYNPAYPLNYRFVEDQFNGMFTNETLIGKLSRIFATLAILISCLGLFGLAAYTAERRTKEIGIRKVLGASVKRITTLLSMDFLQLVIISCLIAFPLAWWMMQDWLLNFPYRTNISWWVYMVAGIMAILIAVITISFQSVKAAIANPVKSLRSE